MKETETASSGEMSSAQKEALLMEAFLEETYRFRRNKLDGKPEFICLTETSEKLSNAKTHEYRPFDTIEENSVVRYARKEGLSKDPRKHIEEYIFSNAVESYDPISEFLGNLPAWNGNDEVGKMIDRIPGVTLEQRGFLRIWFRATVAHWLQMDTLHGNECVPTFIGSQGCGKSTFVQRLLPKSLRRYYLDHINLANKFDKEMALTNYLLVNLDELDAIRPSQHASLKQTLSKTKVSGRVIHSNTQQDRPRYASFVATTNNQHPLTDPTGSRRFICISIPKGENMNNVGEIDHEQLYAQIVNEVRDQHLPYWFDNDQVKRIQELNVKYMAKLDMQSMLKFCIHKPTVEEDASWLSTDGILDLISTSFPYADYSQRGRISLGKALKTLGFKNKETRAGTMYHAVPNWAA